MNHRRLVERAREAAIGGMGAATLTALMGSTRSELVVGGKMEAELMAPRVPAIYLLWHGRLLPCAFHFRHRRLGTLISRNTDGDYITRVVQRWGYEVVRGSSSRGGATALKAIVRLLRDGTPVALTPDGPRGPRQKMKIGPLKAAQLAGVPVVPCAAGAVRGWYFGRWDRFLVPRPFTWVPVGVGEPVMIERGATEADLTGYAEDLEKRLNELTSVVDDAAHSARQ